MTRRLTATSLLSRTLLLRRVTSRTPTPLGPIGLGIPISQSTRRASSTDSGDRGQEPPPPPQAMDSPIKVVFHLRGGRGEGEGGGGAAIDAGKSARRPLSLWPGMYHSPVTNALWEARSSIFERMMDAGSAGAADAAAEQRPQTELLVKTPAQSRTSIVYKFASDDILREQYRDPWNEVRIGKLLEDLDALARTIAVKHCSDEDSTTRPLLVVTASVDKMELKKPIRGDTDLKIAGAVTYVGRSSIDIQIEVTQVDKEKPVGEYGYTLLPYGKDNTKVGDSLSTGEERGAASQSQADKARSCPGAMAEMEMIQETGGETWKNMWELLPPQATVG